MKIIIIIINFPLKKQTNPQMPADKNSIEEIINADASKLNKKELLEVITVIFKFFFFISQQKKTIFIFLKKESLQIKSKRRKDQYQCKYELNF